jgi:hypothetical protein
MLHVITSHIVYFCPGEQHWTGWHQGSIYWGMCKLLMIHWLV